MVCRLSIHTVGDAVECDGSGFYRDIRKYRHKNLHSGSNQCDITDSKILTLQNHACMTIAKSDADNL